MLVFGHTYYLDNKIVRPWFPEKKKFLIISFKKLKNRSRSAHALSLLI